jgi:hypothetical protein
VRYLNYHAYILSRPWLERRDRELFRAGYCCEFCGWQGDNPTRPWANLHVHHLTYDHLGDEPTSDLIVLCGDCHADVHEFPQVADQVRALASRRETGAPND